MALPSARLTFNGVEASEGHLDMIPFQEAARPSKGLRKHNVLVFTEGEGLGGNGLKLQRLVGGELCVKEHHF